MQVLHPRLHILLLLCRMLIMFLVWGSFGFFPWWYAKYHFIGCFFCCFMFQNVLFVSSFPYYLTPMIWTFFFSFKIVPFHRTLSWWFSGSSMKLSDTVVLAELGHQTILKFPSIVSVYFLRESKLPAKLRQALQYIFSLLIFQWIKPWVFCEMISHEENPIVFAVTWTSTWYVSTVH